VKVLLLVGKFILINANGIVDGIVIEEAITKGGLGCRNFMVFLGVNESFIFDPVIESFRIIWRFEIRAESCESGDNGKVELGEVNSHGVPVVLIRFTVGEPLEGVIIGELGDRVAVVITGAARIGVIEELRSGWEIAIRQGGGEGRRGTRGRV
jgi:hypothetical protein